MQNKAFQTYLKLSLREKNPPELAKYEKIKNAHEM